MSKTRIIIMILIVLVVFVAPAWSYDRRWGNYTTRIIGVVLIILLILLLSGRL